MKTMNMKKTFAALLAASVAASAASVADNQDLIESKVDSIGAKRGLEVTGSIRAVAQRSVLDTDADPKALNKLPNTERNEFVDADLNFGFRPFENVRANATVRLGAGMQEYFAAAAKTVSVPWLNVEGNLGNDFYWVLGDFRQQYSPLTLFLPGVDIMYEPQIFARKRHMAQKQQMIEGNQRNLQGANLQFRHKLDDLLGEVRAEGIFARLNRTAVLDLGGAEGNILPKDSVAGATQASNMDKWLLAGNFEWLPFGSNTYVGVTPMYIFDNEDSYSYTYRHPGNNVNALYPDEMVAADPILGDKSGYYEMQNINPFDLDPQKTFILSARAGADFAGMMKNSSLVLDATAEFALSKDEVRNYKEVVAIDPLTGLAVASLEQVKESVDGVALLVNANLGYKTNDWGVKLALDVVYNDSAWYNNLAQSSSFFAQRVLNSDVDGYTVKYGVHSPLYSSFDALYNYSPKFSPVASASRASGKPASTLLGTDDGAFEGSSTNSYSTAVYSKNSYTTNVYTRTQLALLESLSDPALQLALPNGLATANRLGGRANLIANVGEYAEVQGLFSFFQHAAPLFGFKAATYMEFGGGAKVDVFKALGFTKPLEISGSYKHSERTMDTDFAGAYGATVTVPEGTSELKSDFINAGLYVQYLPRLGVNLGFQMINTEFNDYAAEISKVSNVPLMKGKQMQWMVGFDYNIAKHAWLAINYGMVSVSNEYNTTAAIAPGGASADYSEAMQTNLPDYILETDGLDGTYKHEFTQSILEASLNVEF